MTVRVFALLVPQDALSAAMPPLALNVLPQPPETNPTLALATVPMDISLTLTLSGSAEDAPTTLSPASTFSKP